MSVVEMLVAVAILGAVVLGVSTVIERMGREKAARVAKQDADDAAAVVAKQLRHLFQIRDQRTGTGYVAALPGSGAPGAPYLDIVVRKQGGATLEKFRFSTECVAVQSTVSSAYGAVTVQNLAQTPCGVVCPAGQMPAARIAKWNNWTTGSTAAPSDVKRVPATVGGGGLRNGVLAAFVCPTATDAGSASVTIGSVFPVNKSALNTVRSDIVLMLGDNPGAIGWER